MAMRYRAIVAVCAVVIVSCGDSGGSEGNATPPAVSLTSEEQAAVSRYVVEGDHVNTVARNCAGGKIVKDFGALRLDELTKGAAATEKEASVLFDLFAVCVKLNGIVMNTLMANVRRTTDQANCVHDNGLVNDDVKPLYVAAFERKTAPPLSATAQKRYQDALAKCIPQSTTTRG